MAASAVVFVALLWPMPYTAASAWEVWVEDEAGRPLEGTKVRLSYLNEIAESKGHDLDVITDGTAVSIFRLR
jgi:hypothetical protein